MWPRAPEALGSPVAWGDCETWPAAPDSPLCSQYHQLQDEYFTSAVVLALILAASFGLVYLLIIPQ